MKLVNEKGKIFNIINLVDLAVLLLIVAFLSIVILKVTDVKLVSSGENNLITITVSCQGEYPSTAEALKTGDKLVSQNSYIDGQIVSIDSVPSKQFVNTDDGRIVVTEHPVLLDVIVKVSFEAPAGSATIKHGDQQIRVGNKYFIKTQTVEMDGRIEIIEQKEMK